MKTYYNSLVTMINAQAVILKELTGEIEHSKLKSYTDSVVSEFSALGLDLTGDAKAALFRVESIHTITVA